MRKLLFLVTLISAPMLGLISASHGQEVDLVAPEGWVKETIELPPAFAPDMKIVGVEEIRFSPDMFEADSDSFFSYVFVFSFSEEFESTEEQIREEFLAYYRGLAKAVLGPDADKVDIDGFEFELSMADPGDHASSVREPRIFEGELVWFEPFVSRQSQSLRLEIHVLEATEDDKGYWFVCASPAAKDQAIWTEMRRIRDAFDNARNDD